MQKFNVILIVIDGCRVDRISKFPIFQKLQKDGTFFSHTITNAPYTLVAMNSIFTGMYGRKNGINAYYQMFQNPKPECKTLAEYLSENGWYTYGDVARLSLISHKGFKKITSQEDIDDPDFLKIHSEVSGGLFVTNQRNTTSEGWKTLVLPSRNEKSKQPQNPKLKNLKVNDAVECVEGQLLEKNTSPPKRFTDATLLAAMTGIARFVASPEIKKVLKDTDGLGTEATRAGIIELLFKRRFLTKKGKEIHSTDIGRSLINSLPDRMALPDMTAHWESQLESISEKQASYGQFMGHLTGDLHSLIGEIHPRDFAGLRGKGDKKVYRKKRRKSSKV